MDLHVAEEESGLDTAQSHHPNAVADSEQAHVLPANARYARAGLGETEAPAPELLFPERPDPDVLRPDTPAAVSLSPCTPTAPRLRPFDPVPYKPTLAVGAVFDPLTPPATPTRGPAGHPSRPIAVGQCEPGHSRAKLARPDNTVTTRPEWTGRSRVHLNSKWRRRSKAAGSSIVSCNRWHVPSPGLRIFTRCRSR